jgi:hypothetical protein
MLEQVNLMKLKCANQRLEVRYNTKKDECRRVTRIKKEARMTKIEGMELEKEKLIIPPLYTTFPKLAQVIRYDDEVLKIIDLYINTIKYESNIENKGEYKDEMLL